MSGGVVGKRLLDKQTQLPSLLHHCATLFYYINEMVTLSTGLKGMILRECASRRCHPVALQRRLSLSILRLWPSSLIRRDGRRMIRNRFVDVETVRHVFFVYRHF